MKNEDSAVRRSRLFPLTKQKLRLVDTRSVVQEKPTKIEEAVNSQKAILTSLFSRLKSALESREVELLSFLEKTHQKHYKSTESYVSEISSQFSEERSMFEETKALLLQSDKLNCMKHIKVPSLSFENINFKMNEVNVHPSQTEFLLLENVSLVQVNPLEKSIRRSQNTRALKWRYNGEALDALTFTVSHDILLTAIGLCRPYKEGESTYVVDFRVKLGGSTSSQDVYVHHQREEIKHCPKTSVYKIKLKTPVKVKKNTRVSVLFCIDGAHSYKCVDCFPKIERDATWKFYNTIFGTDVSNNRSDSLCGPISDFYYSLI